MANNHHSVLGALAEENKSVFVFGMAWIVNQKCVLIREDRLGLLERDAMFPLV
jgi:hypothetical protein